MDWNRLSREQMIGALGLDRQHTTGDMIVPALAIFGAGLLVGAGLGLLLAPKSGQELRADLATGVDDLKHRGTELIEDTRHKVEAQLGLTPGAPAVATTEQADNPYADA
jgi:hypothetical protein